MNSMSTKSNNRRAKKMGSITLSNTGVILANMKKEVTPISFSEIEKIYIKKHKLSPIQRVVILFGLLNLLFIAFFYLPIEVVVISLILCIPILVVMQNYKYYRLNLLSQSDELYFKTFHFNNKQEHINFVNTLRNEIFYNRKKSPISFQEILKPEATAVVEDYSFASLSMA